MGRLVFKSLGTAAAVGAPPGLPAAGNSDVMPIIVSVSDAEGVPVLGLAPTDFTIDAKAVAQGGSLVEITGMNAGQHGDYMLLVSPVADGQPSTWALGRYIFFLTVTRGGDQGQTLCAVFVPAASASRHAPREVSNDLDD